MKAVTNDTIYQSLKELTVIDEALLNSLYKTARQQKVSLSDLIIEKDILPAANLARVLADLHQVSFIDLKNTPIDETVFFLIPELVAKAQQVIAFKKDKQGLHLAMANPENIQVRDFLSKKTGLPLIIYVASRFDITDALNLYNKDIKLTFEDIISENVAQIKGKSTGQPPIIKIVDTIIEYAYRNKASDIHIEPVNENSLIRFRIDGILHDVVKLPLDLHNQIISRIKVIAKLKIDEHMAPPGWQDCSQNRHRKPRSSRFHCSHYWW